jgi:SAM-dependent methyltransferase
MAGVSGTAAHWDDAYAQGDVARSWFQRQPTISMQMLDAAEVTARDSVIDVGGGASLLVDVLLGRGFRDITVLDISAAGLQYAQRRLGARAELVQWLVADILTWEPRRRYQVWHDRAVFHFLTAPPDRRRYLRVLAAATEPDAIAVFGCFAPEGPPQCSGMPVARYSPAELSDQLGNEWMLIGRDHEEHVTPAGIIQPFTWAVLRRLRPPGV